MGCCYALSLGAARVVAGNSGAAIVDIAVADCGTAGSKWVIADNSYLHTIRLGNDVACVNSV